MRWLCLLLGLLLAGCSKHAPAPAATPTKSATQLAREAWARHDWATARSEAQAAGNPLLAAKAAAKAHDYLTAYRELSALAQGKHIDADGRKLLALSQQTGLKQADRALARAKGDIPQLNGVLATYQKLGASNARQAAVYADLAQAYQKSGNDFEYREMMGRAEKADPGNSSYHVDARPSISAPPAAVTAPPAGQPTSSEQNAVNNASEVLHTHHAWQGQ
ncbi:MAG: hypothetical protein ACYCW6_25005 [Candidatus Xenobia bacterium]